MPLLTYTKAEQIWLKTHPEFSESWLQDRIADDPSLLGLGDLVLIERERRHDKAGRLDLLFADPDENRRYEVELMLGATDESHIIRCIEYWDIERRRYPGYDHCAVLVAEDITSRFLNVLSLFIGTIPLVAIQLNALKIEERVVLDFVRVIDRVALRKDDEVEGKITQTDRKYWDNRATAKTVEMVDAFLEMINETAEPKQALNYNKYYIGLTNGSVSRNFLYFKPKKQFTHVLCKNLPDAQEWTDRFEEAGIPATVDDSTLKVTVKPKDLDPHRELLQELVARAVDVHLS